MVENPSPQVQTVERSTSSSSSRNGSKKNTKYYPTTTVEDTRSEHQIECSGQNCKSCTATVVADCVAICCCPCAVINFLTLTLVKVPFTMGRRGLRLIKKGRSKKKKRKDQSDSSPPNGGVIEKVQNCNREMTLPVPPLEGTLEIQNGIVNGGGENFCARVEAERVCLEFYQVGHLGFGRVSFTGIPAKGN